MVVTRSLCHESFLDDGLESVVYDSQYELLDNSPLMVQACLLGSQLQYDLYINDSILFYDGQIPLMRDGTNANPLHDSE